MCTVTRGDLPVSIRWFKDGHLISVRESDQLAELQPRLDEESGNNFGRQFARSNQQQTEQLLGSQSMGGGHSNGLAIKQLDPYSSTLTFASLQSHHRGLYSCEATNEVGRANQSSPLVVHGESPTAPNPFVYLIEL